MVIFKTLKCYTYTCICKTLKQIKVRRFSLRFVLELFSKCVATWYLRRWNGRGLFGPHLSPKKKSFVYIEIQKSKYFA